MSIEIQWPSHAYVPGKTQRHKEGAFTSICAAIHPGLSPDQIANSSAFHHGLLFLDAGFYWESHEVLEPVWLALPVGSDERLLVTCLIQVANAKLKLKMEKPKAAARICVIVHNLLEGLPRDSVLGIDRGTILQHLDELDCILKDVL